jgi:isopentenyl diphosphate isomerase/L-lactate dehydrogenase-like FMN-dependent dehydrogenase
MTKETRNRARELMDGFCRVCPVCDGRACRGEVPGMGGAGSGASFIRNVAALERLKLPMRTIHSVCEPNTDTQLFGRRLILPLLCAPVGGVVFNMSSRVPEKEYIRSVIRGCAAAGTLGCTGDGELEEIFDGAEAALRESAGAGIPFVKPWEEERLTERIERIAATGAPAFGIDIDAAGLVTLSSMGHTVYPKDVEMLKRIGERNSLAFVIKGIMGAGEARAAVEAGADGIVVSNHGGRVLDHTLATAEVLPDIAAAVGGKTAILVDGGVRSGSDVFKMLALGADAVLAGRPFAIAAIGGGEEAVRSELELWHRQLRHTMVMTGTAGLHDITGRSLLRPEW